MISRQGHPRCHDRAPVRPDDVRTHFDRPISRLNCFCRAGEVMCASFSPPVASGGPEQKTIIFAPATALGPVAAQMNNCMPLVRDQNSPTCPYAFKCTASVGGAQYWLICAGGRSHFTHDR
jgi:hypothetical protein